MKNIGEIYKALLAGETLDNGEFSCRLLDGRLVDDEDTSIELDFSAVLSWNIYKEPKWYENIPDGGVLCWVNDGRMPSNKHIRIITSFWPDKNHAFWAGDGEWRNAKPLTKQEIQIFMDNAPVN